MVDKRRDWERLASVSRGGGGGDGYYDEPCSCQQPASLLADWRTGGLAESASASRARRHTQPAGTVYTTTAAALPALEHVHAHMSLFQLDTVYLFHRVFKFFSNQAPIGQDVLWPY